MSLVVGLKRRFCGFASAVVDSRAPLLPFVAFATVFFSKGTSASGATVLRGLPRILFGAEFSGGGEFFDFLGITAPLLGGEGTGNCLSCPVGNFCSLF